MRVVEWDKRVIKIYIRPQGQFSAETSGLYLRLLMQNIETTLNTEHSAVQEEKFQTIFQDMFTGRENIRC